MPTTITCASEMWVPGARRRRRGLVMRGLLALAVAAVAAVVLSPAGVPAPGRTATDAAALAGPSAGELLAMTQECDQISTGRYKTDVDKGRTIAICGAEGAVWWRADMDIDCDGRRTIRCSRKTDPAFLPDTAFHQSDGRPLLADRSHYVVVPSPSKTWTTPRSASEAPARAQSSTGTTSSTP